MNLATMRMRVRKPLGIGGTDGSAADVLDDNAIDEYLNTSYGLLLDRYAFREKEITATVSTVAGVRNYTMPNPHDGLRQIDIVHPTSLQHTRLEPMSVADYTNKYNASTSAQGYPTNYVRENCLFRLYPTPDAVYTLNVRYWGILADLSDINNIIPIPQVWLQPIIYGAVIDIAMNLTNIPLADAFARRQAALIAEIVPTQTKEEEDYHTAGLEVLGREY